MERSCGERGIQSATSLLSYLSERFRHHETERSPPCLVWILNPQNPWSLKNGFDTSKFGGHFVMSEQITTTPRCMRWGREHLSEHVATSLSPLHHRISHAAIPPAPQLSHPGLRVGNRWTHFWISQPSSAPNSTPDPRQENFHSGATSLGQTKWRGDQFPPRTTKLWSFNFCLPYKSFIAAGVPKDFGHNKMACSYL